MINDHLSSMDGHTYIRNDYLIDSILPPSLFISGSGKRIRTTLIMIMIQPREVLKSEEEEEEESSRDGFNESAID